MKFLDVFEPVQKGDFGLTEEFIYKSIQYDEEFIPVWGGNQEHIIIERLVSVKGRTKSNKPITIFDGEGVIISLDGSAGSMTYKNSKQRFALNHHAGFFKLKKNPLVKVDLEFFSIFYKKQLQEMSVSEGSKTLTLDQLYDAEFDIPSYDEQIKFMQTMMPVLSLKQKIRILHDEIDKINECTLAEDYQQFQAKTVPISQILDYLSGNSGLTEEFLYSQIQSNAERKYRILTGSIDYSSEEFIHKCRHPKNSDSNITALENKPVIHVVRKGIYAGHVDYFESGNYTINDDTYLLYLKDDIPYKVNLKWLMYQIRHLFHEYTSSSDNKTWNMTNFFQDVTVDIPLIDAQDKIVKEYNLIEKFLEKIITVENKTNQLLSKTVVG